MEKEVAVREWCIDRAIQMCKRSDGAGIVLSTAVLLEEYLKGNIEVELKSFDGFNIKCEKSV